MADNNRDCVERGRHITPSGHRNGNAKLTAEQAARIKSDHRTYEAIAADYGIALSNVHSIKSGRTWREVPAHRPTAKGLEI